MDLRDHIVACTSCGMPLEKIKIYLTFSLAVNVEKESGAWELLSNLSVAPKEVLCEKCFSKFADLVHEKMDLNLTPKE